MLTRDEIKHEFRKILTMYPNSQLLDSDNILWKWVGEEFIGKPAVQMKDLRMVWREDAVKTPELIDPTFYNLDGSRKSNIEICTNLKIKYPNVKFALCENPKL